MTENGENIQKPNSSVPQAGITVAPPPAPAPVVAEKKTPLEISVPKQQPVVLLTPKITVIGVGGGGGNAINNMVDAKLEGIDFIACNTDAQALNVSKADVKIQIGLETTKGQGSGARPEVGKESAEEAIDEIAKVLEDTNMLFITAGMGGGTGTGAAPVIAKLAQEKGILTVGVVTKPFNFEGKHRMDIAKRGIEELAQYVDTLIVIANQNLFIEATAQTTFAEAFKRADQVLQEGVRSVTDLILVPGMINLDFADIRTIMSEMGRAMMGTGEASGENRAIDAALAAISNPLLENASMMGSKAVLINFAGGEDMTLVEVDEAVTRIREEVDPDANIIFGASLDNALKGSIRISVVATGITQPEETLSPFMNKNSSVFSSAFSKQSAAPAPQSSGFSILRKAATASSAMEAPAFTPVEEAEPVSAPETESAAYHKESVFEQSVPAFSAPHAFAAKPAMPSSAIPSMPSAKDLFAGTTATSAPQFAPSSADVFDHTGVKAPVFEEENYETDSEYEEEYEETETSYEAPVEEEKHPQPSVQNDLFPDLPPPVVPSSAKERPRSQSLWKRVTSFSLADNRDEEIQQEPSFTEEYSESEEDDLDIPAFLRHKP